MRKICSPRAGRIPLGARISCLVLAAFAALTALVVCSGNAAAAESASAPESVRAQAREIFAHIVGIESSIGKANVASYVDQSLDRLKRNRPAAPRNLGD